MFTYFGDVSSRRYKFDKIEETLANYERLEDFESRYSYINLDTLRELYGLRKKSFDTSMSDCLSECFNHKVVRVERLVENQDCYDLEVENENHNFLTEAGVFIHNSEEDVRFAKTIQKHQAEFVEGLLHVGLVHLYLQGASEEDMESFTIEMNNPSSASEKKKLELMQARLDIAKAAWDYNNDGLNLMSYKQVLSEVLHFTEDDIKSVINEQFAEKKITWRLRELATNGHYEEPDPEKRKALLKRMADDEDGQTGFQHLQFESENFAFEGDSTRDILRQKIDQEIAEMFPVVVAKPTKKMIRILTEQLGQVKKDLTNKTK